MVTYYTVVHADSKKRVEWEQGKPGYGWMTQPHKALELIKHLEDNFEEDGKLVMRQIIGGARPQVTYLTLDEAKQDIPKQAKEYLHVHPHLSEDPMMKETLKALAFFRERDKRNRKPAVKAEPEDLF